MTKPQTVFGSFTLCHEGSDAGWYEASELRLTLDNVPTDTSANWSHRLRVAQNSDGVPHQFTIAGIDSVGNRTAEPLIYDLIVDNVAPAIILTDADSVHLATIQPNGTLTPTVDFALSGTVSDGHEVQAVRIVLRRPDGTMVTDITTLFGLGKQWRYENAEYLDRDGSYAFWLEAVDTAGNLTVIGSYTLLVNFRPNFQMYLPIITGE